MVLPKIDLPLFELELPSTGEKIKYRPFSVKEEKILLIAQESNDIEQEILAAKQIVNNCLIGKDIGDLPMFDLEYVMLCLRARSIDNAINFSIKDPDTDERVELEIDIENVTITRDPNHTNKVKINDEFYLFLKYPSIDQFLQVATYDSNDPLSNYYIMISCLDKLASEEDVYDFKDYAEDDIHNFMDSMTGEVVKGIQDFFETMPKLRHELHYTNKEGKEQVFVLEGMRSFFM